MYKTILYQTYSFSSAHRLNSKSLSSKENWQIYDKCNNLNGHGHDYTLEVGISGEINPDTGMIIDIEEMNKRVQTIIDQLDYKHLNKEVDYFKSVISTGENIIQFLWKEMDQLFTDQQLYYLKLWECSVSPSPATTSSWPRES